MERLTFEGNFCDIAVCLENPCPHDGSCSQRKVWERLKAYEDTGLEPEYIPELLADTYAMVTAINVKEELEKADRTVLSKALETYGAEAQTLMVFEEMSELQKELSKHARGKDNTMEIAEEIADVQIMLEQMIILHDCADAVKGFRIAKLIRLAEKLEEGAE